MGRWAKSHDQRKGQWLYNALRIGETCVCDTNGVIRHKARLADKLWNMSNEEFDAIMKDYDK